MFKPHHSKANLHCAIGFVFFQKLTIQHHLELLPVHVHSWLHQRPITAKAPSQPPLQKKMPALHRPSLLQTIHPRGDVFAGIYESLC